MTTKFSRLIFTTAVVAGAAVASPFAGADAADHEVKLLNKGDRGAFVFEPALLKIAPGDVVNFVATDKGHDAQSIKTMMPDGAEPFASGINKNISVTFTIPGVYGYQCKPHYGMGMVGLIVVGDGAPANLDAAKAVKHPGKANQTFQQLFTEAGL